MWKPVALTTSVEGVLVKLGEVFDEGEAIAAQQRWTPELGGKEIRSDRPEVWKPAAVVARSDGPSIWLGS